MFCCPVMCCEYSGMPVFAASAAHLWIKDKQPVLTRRMLIREEKFHYSPTQYVVEGGHWSNSGKNIFTFQICCVWKAPLSVASALCETGRQRTAHGEMTQAPNGWLGFFFFPTRKPIITWNMMKSEPRHELAVNSVGTCLERDMFCIMCLNDLWFKNVACDPEMWYAARKKH